MKWKIILSDIRVMLEVMKLTGLKPGEQGRIKNFENSDLEIKLMEMGCLPGEVIIMEQVAPLGGPVSIRVSGYLLSLRRTEADQVIVENLK
ncbi:MAG: ferrous iron transport protein A [Chitinophagaceae bacterium]